MLHYNCPPPPAPFAIAIADRVRSGLRMTNIEKRTTTFDGKLTLKETAEKLGIEFTAPEEAIQ